MEEIGWPKKLLLGIQHVFAMFGATVLMPALTGMDPSVALLAAGIGTFIFHGVTGRWKYTYTIGQMLLGR